MPEITRRLISLVPSKQTIDARVTVVALDGIILVETVAAVNLDTLVGDVIEHLRGKNFHHGTLGGIFFRGFEFHFGGIGDPCSAPFN